MNLVNFKYYSTGRNALSLYFELEFDNRIKIHKTYYEYDGFISYLINQNDYYPNIRDSEKEVDFEYFCNLLISDDAIKRLTFYKEIINLIEKIDSNRFIKQNEYSIEIESTIDIINNYFYGCTFFDNGKIIEKDESVDLIDEKFSIVYPTEFNKDDRIMEPALYDDYLNIDNLNLKYRVFDVGQANCSAILNFDGENNYKVACVFDLGCEKEKRNNYALNDMLNKIDYSTTIIISHFDSDHYNLIQYNQLPPTVRWLFSSTPPKTVKGHKIFQLLLTEATKKTYSGKVYSYNAPYRLSNYLRIEEKQDNTKDLYQSTVLNANSVISILETRKNNILIPGDALYHDFPKGVFTTNYSVVLIPHHCCYYPSPGKRDSYANIIRQIVKYDPVGIAQCGKNKYGHANISHLNWYKNRIIWNEGKIYDDFKEIISFGNTNDSYIDFDL